jgi:hypothetical protein
MRAVCHASFHPEVNREIASLVKNHYSGPFIYRCDGCGKGVAAIQDEKGEWVPEPHHLSNSAASISRRGNKKRKERVQLNRTHPAL